MRRREWFSLGTTDSEGALGIILEIPRRWCEEGGRDWHDVATSLESQSCQQALDVIIVCEGFSCKSFRGNAAMPPLGFYILAVRSMREIILLFQATQFVVFPQSCHKKKMYPVRPWVPILVFLIFLI